MLSEAESSSLQRIARTQLLSRAIFAAGLYAVVDGVVRVRAGAERRDPGYFPAIRLGTEGVKVLVQEGQELLERQQAREPAAPVAPAR